MDRVWSLVEVDYPSNSSLYFGYICHIVQTVCSLFPEYVQEILFVFCANATAVCHLTKVFVDYVQFLVFPNILAVDVGATNPYEKPDLFDNYEKKEDNKRGLVDAIRKTGRYELQESRDCGMIQEQHGYDYRTG
jgi:hypothetical protein